jgi:hypothetical protein
VSGRERFFASLRRLRRPVVYDLAPASGSEAETRQALDKLVNQVAWNRRLLIALALAVVANDTSMIVELVRTFGG